MSTVNNTRYAALCTAPTSEHIKKLEKAKRERWVKLIKDINMKID